VFAEVQGAGGGGGGVPATAAGTVAEGGGGAGGGYAAKWFDADALGATEAIVVGTGGTVSAGASGSSGGVSEFGDEFGTDGGGGGTVGSASSTTVHTSGGNGGSGYDNGSGFPPAIRNGGQGSPGVVVNGNTYRLNAGGSSEGDGERLLSSATASGAGVAGARGSGGSGARNGNSQGTRSGGVGGDGYVRVTTFF
jgi:hypothetical protein